MLAVILKILSILGIILLILLCMALFVLLLVLFIPIVYKVDAAKSESDLSANIRARWLFGFLRVKYIYPEPGRVIVKMLWITVYDSGKPSEKKTKKKTTEKAESKAEDGVKFEDIDEPQAEVKDDIVVAKTTVSEEPMTDNSEEPVEENEQKSMSEKLFAKYEKIKYTIQQFYAKIKHIWENVSFYKNLLQDEQTKTLISHVFGRLGKILKHIRPRKLKADVIFGTGSPDTTGYAYGIYGMFSPQLGKNVYITPDFTQKIMTGTVSASGHITVFTLVVNVLAVLLDKRLHLLIKRVKTHSAKQAKKVSEDNKAETSV